MLELVEVTVRLHREAGDTDEARQAVAGALVKAVLDQHATVFAAAGAEVVAVEGVMETEE